MDGDPDLLERWLTILGLIANAETMLARRGGSWAALALVSADAAIEGMLGLAARGAPKVHKGPERFETLLERAAPIVDISTTFQGRLLQIHKERNLALHVGGRMPLGSSEEAVRLAHELQRLAAAKSPLVETIGTAGPIDAVASVVRHPAIAEALRLADRHLSARRFSDALDQVAIAFDIAVEELDPQVRTTVHPPNLWAESRRRDADQNNIRIQEQMIRWAQSQLWAQETYLLALVLGLEPSELRDLRRILGAVDRQLDRPPIIERDASVEVNEASVEGALHTAADVIFRLSRGDAIRVSQP